MEGRKIDSFGTFLEQVKRYNIGQKAPESRQARDDQKPGNVLLRIINESDALPISDLMRRSGLGFSEFADALKSIEQADLVSLEGPSGEEVVTLTERGKRVAEIVG